MTTDNISSDIAFGNNENFEEHQKFRDIIRHYSAGRKIAIETLLKIQNQLQNGKRFADSVEQFLPQLTRARMALLESAVDFDSYSRRNTTGYFMPGNYDHTSVLRASIDVSALRVGINLQFAVQYDEVGDVNLAADEYKEVRNLAIIGGKHVDQLAKFRRPGMLGIVDRFKSALWRTRELTAMRLVFSEQAEIAENALRFLSVKASKKIRKQYPSGKMYPGISKIVLDMAKKGMFGMPKLRRNDLKFLKGCLTIMRWQYTSATGVSSSTLNWMALLRLLEAYLMVAIYFQSKDAAARRDAMDAIQSYGVAEAKLRKFRLFHPFRWLKEQNLHTATSTSNVFDVFATRRSRRHLFSDLTSKFDITK